jgi:hypothetical protein
MFIENAGKHHFWRTNHDSVSRVPIFMKLKDLESHPLGKFSVRVYGVIIRVFWLFSYLDFCDPNAPAAMQPYIPILISVHLPG